ncbi:MAG: SIMPL domain-containing protein [Planctomyces sp.]|nr:SIMPL domain-containing protein [Planctomyces sp.]
MTRSQTFHSACLAALLLSMGAAALRAQDFAPSRGILVAGRGEAKSKPNVVELSGTVTGEAELASDAITKYRDNRQRAVDAVENLKIENLSIEGGGVAINSSLSAAAMQAMAQGMPATGTGNNRLQVSEPLKIRIEGVDKLTTEELLETLVRIVDAGKDAGVAIGPQVEYNPYVYNPRQGQASSLATFRMSDISELRQQAYEGAIKDARTQAERLAKLSGVTLGRVTSVREGTQQNQTQMNVMYYYGAQSASEPDAYSTGKLEQITVSVVLQVEFAIE